MQAKQLGSVCRGEFTDDYKKTIGVDFLEKQQYVDSVGEDVKLMVWDTAGQEEFDSITRTYYRGILASSAARASSRKETYTTKRGNEYAIEPAGAAGACAAVLVFSTTDQASFQAVTRWKDKVGTHQTLASTHQMLAAPLKHSLTPACSAD